MSAFERNDFHISGVNGQSYCFYLVFNVSIFLFKYYSLGKLDIVWNICTLEVHVVALRMPRPLMQVPVRLGTVDRQLYLSVPACQGSLTSPYLQPYP